MELLIGKTRNISIQSTLHVVSTLHSEPLHIENILVKLLNGGPWDLSLHIINLFSPCSVKSIIHLASSKAPAGSDIRLIFKT